MVGKRHKMPGTLNRHKMKLRLRKREIIRGHEHFRQIIRDGQKTVGKHVIVFAVPSEEVKIGVSVGRRVCNAVKRNREKRRLREIFRQNKPSFAGLSVLLIGRQTILGSGFRSLQEDVIKAVSQVREKLKENPVEPIDG